MMENEVFCDADICIYGAGAMGRSLARKLQAINLPIKCFIDQRAAEHPEVDGLPCVSPSTVNKSFGTIILGVFNREASHAEIAASLEERGIKKIIPVTQLKKYWPDFHLESFWYSSDFQYSDHDAKVAKLAPFWSDEKSVELMNRLHRFRKSGSLSDHVEGSGFSDQYFCKDIAGWLGGENLVMIDCGAYDGDTIEAAVGHGISLSRVYCFEPSEENFKKLTDRVSRIKKPECILVNCATWSSSKTLLFSDDASESAKVSTEGQSVPAVAIDDYLAGKSFQFLKIDVEGADLETLKGAIVSLKTWRPSIAVSVYHRPGDLYEIPAFLTGILKDYRFYLRQHGESGFDTVLYAQPF
jgi:FkbM family methyltransferase